LFSLSSLYLANNSNLSLNPNSKNNSHILLKSSSDWVGPYIVKSNFSSSSKNIFFTGGWHSVFKNNIEAPTAKTLSYTITADGKTKSLD
jgi:hypothetical protein